MSKVELESWFQDFVMRTRAKLIEQSAVDIEYCALYEALRLTMTVSDIMTIMEQEKAA